VQDVTRYDYIKWAPNSDINTRTHTHTHSLTRTYTHTHIDKNKHTFSFYRETRTGHRSPLQHRMGHQHLLLLLSLPCSLHGVHMSALYEWCWCGAVKGWCWSWCECYLCHLLCVSICLYECLYIRTQTLPKPSGDTRREPPAAATSSAFPVRGKDVSTMHFADARISTPACNELSKSLRVYVSFHVLR
jgi:hypothetical protein